MKIRLFPSMTILAAAVFALSFSASANMTGPYTLETAATPLPNTKPGSAENGRKVFYHRKKGNCLACHAVTDLEDVLFHGEVGPPLDGVGSNYTEAELRLQVVNPKVNNSDSIMPAYHRTEGLRRVLVKFQNKPILTAQEVEDIVAYMMTLKDE